MNRCIRDALCFLERLRRCRRGGQRVAGAKSQANVSGNSEQIAAPKIIAREGRALVHIGQNSEVFDGGASSRASRYREMVKRSLVTSFESYEHTDQRTKSEPGHCPYHCSQGVPISDERLAGDQHPKPARNSFVDRQRALTARSLLPGSLPSGRFRTAKSSTDTHSVNAGDAASASAQIIVLYRPAPGQEASRLAQTPPARAAGRIRRLLWVS